MVKPTFQCFYHCNLTSYEPTPMCIPLFRRPCFLLSLLELLELYSINVIILNTGRKLSRRSEFQHLGNFFPSRAERISTLEREKRPQVSFLSNFQNIYKFIQMLRQFSNSQFFKSLMERRGKTEKLILRSL